MPTMPHKKSKVEEVFSSELQKIQNHGIRKFVVWVFDKFCPDYFWTCPCSTSGKYHPRVSLGVGGLVRHVKLAVWWGEELLRAVGYTMESYVRPAQLRDEVIAALLLHDLRKNGMGLDAQGRPLDRGVTGTHGVTLATKINELMPIQDSIIPLPSYVRILDGISGHMGVWTTDVMHRPHQPFADLIHMADYCASRKVDDEMKRLSEDNQ